MHDIHKLKTKATRNKLFGPCVFVILLGIESLLNASPGFRSYRNPDNKDYIRRRRNDGSAIYKNVPTHGNLQTKISIIQ